MVFAIHFPDRVVSVSELSKIRAKTLVIAGTNDMIKEEHTKLIAESIAGAELALIRGIILSQIKSRKSLTEGYWSF